MEGRSQRMLKTEHKAKNSGIVGMLENAGMKDWKAQMGSWHVFLSFFGQFGTCRITGTEYWQTGMVLFMYSFDMVMFWTFF